MSFTGRGIFDGDSPESTTTIFDPAIFDIQITEPVAANEIIVFTHGNQTNNAFTHGNELIPRSIQ